MISACIEEWTSSAKHDIDEIYAFSKLAERGAARFQTEKNMLSFMVANRGGLWYVIAGKDVYANTDRMHDSHPDKTKAIRKILRLIIEKEGGDGKTIKKNIITDYWKGKVWYKDQRVAEWYDSAKIMKLSGTVAQHSTKTSTTK